MMDVFPQAFLDGLADLELVSLQHDMRRVPEDKPFLDQVLGELSRRLERRERVALAAPEIRE